MSGSPLTPPAPSPQKFGVSLIKLGGFTVRISGERGSQIREGSTEMVSSLSNLSSFKTINVPRFLSALDRDFIEARDFCCTK